MAYEVVFDVTQESPSLALPAFGLLFVGVGVILWIKRRTMSWKDPKKPPMSAATQSAFAGFILGTGILWTVIAATVVLAMHYGATQAMSNGSAHVVEGVVEDFHPTVYKNDK